MQTLVQNLNISALKGTPLQITNQWGNFPSPCVLGGVYDPASDNASFLVRTPFSVLPPGTMVLVNNNERRLTVQAYHLSIEDGDEDCVEVDIASLTQGEPVAGWGNLYLQIIVPCKHA